MTYQHHGKTGEVEDEFKAVLDTTPIPTWPENSPKRWNVLLEAVLVGSDTVVPVTSGIDGVPSGRAVCCSHGDI